MSAPEWALQNYQNALDRWVRTDHPNALLVDQVERWAADVRHYGPRHDWVLLGTMEDEFVTRIPQTNVLASGTLLAYERRVLFGRFSGT